MDLRSAGRRKALGLIGPLAFRLGHKMLPVVPPECDPATVEIIRRVQPYTLTSSERIIVLCDAVRYLSRARVPGAVLECGVGHGGSMLAAALALLEVGAGDRDLYLYDTFTGQPPPDERDVIPAGLSRALAPEFDRAAVDDTARPERKMAEVRGLIEAAGYPPERIHLIPGMVEETIPAQAPNAIALCRLDTDWYGSTAHEMRHLYPRISPGGVLLIDDYGLLPGARRAVDEYLAADEREQIMLTRVDESARIAVIPPT